MRIHKVLSDNSIVSRRAAEDMIKKGRITVNGRKATLGQDIDPRNDIVAIDGEKVELRGTTHKYYIALNKPRGYVTTMSDELGRKCMTEFVEQMPVKVYPIGRLDKDSEGLILLTNDGEFANFIMHPRHHVSKTYRVTIPSDVSEQQLINLSTGVKLDDDSVTAEAQVVIVTKEANRTVLRITIHEGKNRQIRRMCEAVGLTVARLRRTNIGPVKLGMLQTGEWRELSATEVGALRNAVKIHQIQGPGRKNKKFSQRTGNKGIGIKKNNNKKK